MTVAIGMSGGVDSSVAAALLQQDGHDVIGLTMKFYDSDSPNNNACFSQKRKADIQTAKDICAKLNIAHYTIDLSKEFKAIVLDYFCDSYNQGLTPNPCVMCNKHIKFDLFLEKAREIVQFDAFATGHYATVEKVDNIYYLRKSMTEKDQTYFLHAISQKALSNLILPLGDKTKDQVRYLAELMGLSVSKKKDSQDFVSPESFEDKPGYIVYNDKIIGKHHGVSHYTIGQKKGLDTDINKPLHVIKIDSINNVLIVAEKQNLYSATCKVNLMLSKHDNISGDITAKIRSGHKPIKVKSINANIIEFCEPQFAVTPGQFLVLYKNGYVIGGGRII